MVKFTAGGKDITSHSKTDSFGRKVFDELQLGSGFVSRQFAYHAGQVTDAHKDGEKLKSAATTQLVSQIVLSDGRTLSYAYDAEERITAVTESREVNGETVTTTTSYTYDALGQLLTESVDGVVVNEMTYDSYGNILTKNAKTYTYGDGVWKDKLTAFDGADIAYDAQGNPTTYLGHSLTWEKGRQLKSFDGNTYTYNANGIRTSKTVGGITHNYILDGTNILKETWAGNTLIPLYDNEEAVCGIEYNGTAYYFLKNLQGDVIAITDADGKTVANYGYDAWGVCTVISDTSDCNIATINPYRYRGYYYDSDIGMYYLQSRYYDPSVGRFVNGDEIIFCCGALKVVQTNVFVYCENNVVINSDPFGYFSIPRGVVVFAIDALIWAVFSAGAASFAFLTQPVKAMARYAGKALIKSRMLGILRGFTKTLANAIYRIASFLVPVIKKAVGWLFRNWAAKLNANKLATTIAGGIASVTANSFLNAVVSNITLFLSLGGLIGGLWDWWSDRKLNGKIKLW